jgi:hypothetical protein
MSALEQFLSRRSDFMRAVDPPVGQARVVLAPACAEQLEVDPASGLAHRPETLAGFPFVIDRRLPSAVLAVFYSGAEPFDPHHPERTVVLRRAEP